MTLLPYWRWCALLLLLALPQSCRTTDQRTEVKDGLAADDTFIGCRPSPGECQSSCPDRRGRAFLDTQRCEAEDPGAGAYACYCGGDGGQGGGGADLCVPEGDVWVFHSCIPQPGDCAYVGCGGPFCVKQDPVRCDNSLGYAPFSCFCQK